MKCNAKVQPESENIGRCGKCGMMQNMEVCKMAELFVVSGVKAARPLNLRAFGRIVLQITGQPNVTEESLITAKPFTLTYTEGYIIQSVKRKKSSS